MKLHFESNPRKIDKGHNQCDDGSDNGCEAWRAEVAEQEELELTERTKIADILQLSVELVTGATLYWMLGEDDATMRRYWSEKPWENIYEQENTSSEEARALTGPGEEAD
ncbi:hypothetical protein [Klebsiella oxytoca]|uniref:hypothetical protein n=1 Tax=Klebsiella oxytoca TaxID=571 RepID=UPI0039C94244